ncbi:MAG: hypothetical protein HZB29_02850 [Nitrospinae bacterium]|nr:hypothetical protein [Nitrospinota bacterium]
MWLHKNELGRDEKRVRALYKYLRDELESHLVDFALVDSYKNFLQAGVPYPFVEKRELKPRAKVVEQENQLMNGFIAIFSEGAFPPEMKKNIRFFDDNKVTKENLGELKLTGMNFADRFQTKQKYFETTGFMELLRNLLPVDYALLIQRDISIKHKNRFYLSHYHVRIDWMLDDAAEALGKELRYVSKDIYEKGDKSAQEMVEKLFEYYSFHHSVSGRRTAAVLAAQFLRQAPFYSTVFVSSSESRTMTKIAENGIAKYTLIKLENDDIAWIEHHPNGNPDFRRKFLIHETEDFGVAVLMVVYAHNEHSKAPTDGRLREIKGDVAWLRIRNQLLIPKSDERLTRPIRYQTIYDQQDPMAS